MQLVQELDEVLGVFARAFLRAGLPAAVIIFAQAFQPVQRLIEPRRLVGGGVLLAIVHADADDPVAILRRSAYTSMMSIPCSSA